MQGKRLVLAGLLGALAQGAAWAQEDGAASRVEELESRLAALEARGAGGDPVPRVSVNGFLSAAASWADTRDSYDGGLLTDEWTFSADSLAGVQLTMQVHERVQAVTQLVARGDADYAVSAEWAYAGWRPAAEDELRAGRQRLPLFMLSEYLDVGYAHPWAKPPIEAYNPDLPTAYDGLSWTHRLNRGAWSHDLMLYAGAEDTDLSGGSFEIEDMAGFAWFASRDAWTLRLGYAQAQTTFDNPMLAAFQPLAGAIRDEEGLFGGAGVQYDDGRLLVLAEYEVMQVGSWFPDYRQGYVTLGWRAGRYTPHLTWAAVETTDKDERRLAVLPGLCPPVCADAPANNVPFPADTLNRLLDGDQDSVTLGLRYDLQRNTALKADWTRVIDTDGTWGKFTPAGGNFLFGTPPDDVDVVRLAVDVVF